MPKQRSSLLPNGYDDFLHNLKERIRSAQIRAALAVNRELVLLYWQIGQQIRERQQRHGWGAKVIEKISKDLRLRSGNHADSYEGEVCQYERY